MLVAQQQTDSVVMGVCYGTESDLVYCKTADMQVEVLTCCQGMQGTQTEVKAVSCPVPLELCHCLVWAT